MDLSQLSADDVKRGLEIGQWLMEQMKRLGIVLGKKQEIMMTGMQGIGKTDLCNYMTGKAYRAGYKPSEMSMRAEKEKLNKAIGLLVLPGQQITPRWDAAQETILGKKPPIGIIHVVANGFATIRSDIASEILYTTNKLKTIESLRDSLKKQEEKELQQVCEWIRQSHRQSRKPSWLMLAVTKYDLYADDTSILQRYYPGGTGPVVKQLEKLTTQIGSDHFQWQATNVCGSLVPYVWKNAHADPAISTVQRDIMIVEFVKKIFGLCGQEK